MTRYPRRASSVAAVLPAGPPPITAMSHCSMVIRGLLLTPFAGSVAVSGAMLYFRPIVPMIVPHGGVYARGPTQRRTRLRRSWLAEILPYLLVCGLLRSTAGGVRTAA